MIKAQRESDIQREVLDALRKMGKFALRLNSGKVRIGSRFIQLCPKGTPDILVIEQSSMPAFQFVTWIEMKRPKEVQTPEQHRFEIEAKARRERYFVCRSLDDVLAIWQ